MLKMAVMASFVAAGLLASDPAGAAGSCTTPLAGGQCTGFSSVSDFYSYISGTGLFSSLAGLTQTLGFGQLPGTYFFTATISAVTALNSATTSVTTTGTGFTVPGFIADNFSASNTVAVPGPELGGLSVVAALAAFGLYRRRRQQLAA
ncbi:hypothetical protein [Chthonobacter albigriseus]|uniref:hypothetical protein n=1 Tax=Chthonobacter albigriseus TaxID=1683161 RepID=UPI0015EEA1BD|nr:hypothetical protein [Chthonobacter albigriseus]